MGKVERKVVSLKSGRPPFSNRTSAIVASTSKRKSSSKITRNVIRAHHNLHKSRAKALAEGNAALAADLDSQIQGHGGLEAYQSASLTGQSKDRGGDSSALLVNWLEEEGLVGISAVTPQHKGLRVLEVGSLSSRNAISSMIGRGIECVKRIDLKSQEPGKIEEIDFMDLPIPQDKEHQFDIVSLSLVLNYVPEASARGEMLQRTTDFLRVNRPAGSVVPCLFFVLPLPCISNSRYVTLDRLREIMASLGYVSLRVHQSAKLHYELYHLLELAQTTAIFKKTEINPGKSRNNFSITLSGSR